MLVPRFFEGGIASSHTRRQAVRTVRRTYSQVNLTIYDPVHLRLRPDSKYLAKSQTLVRAYFRP